LLRKIEANLNEPYASLMNGLLFGARKGFTDSVNDMLTATGLTHIVAVSGYNVSLVILFIEKSLFFVPRNIRFWFLIIAIFLFAIIAGLSASVLRACIMGFISVFVLQYGYSSNFLRAVLLTAVAMIMWNPAHLYFDLGFQLSFYATLGVMYLAPFLKFSFVTEKAGLRDSLKLTVASQLATLPTILYYFGNLSFISPLANLLVAPFLPVLMLLGFLILIFGNMIIVSGMLTLITTSISNLFFVLLGFLAFVPYSMIRVPIQNGIILLLTYGLLLIVIFKKK
jgi:competence protein ComEC